MHRREIYRHLVVVAVVLALPLVGCENSDETSESAGETSMQADDVVTRSILCPPPCLEQKVEDIDEASLQKNDMDETSESAGETSMQDDDPFPDSMLCSPVCAQQQREIVEAAVHTLDTDALLNGVENREGIPGETRCRSPDGRCGNDSDEEVDSKDDDTESPAGLIESAELTCKTNHFGDDCDTVEPAIWRYNSRVEACYQGELYTNSEAAGAVRLRLELENERGWRISDYEILSDEVGGDVGVCIGRILRATRVPPPSNASDRDTYVPVLVSYEFSTR